MPVTEPKLTNTSRTRKTWGFAIWLTKDTPIRFRVATFSASMNASWAATVSTTRVYPSTSPLINWYITQIDILYSGLHFAAAGFRAGERQHDGRNDGERDRTVFQSGSADHLPFRHAGCGRQVHRSKSSRLHYASRLRHRLRRFDSFDRRRQFQLEGTILRRLVFFHFY